LTANVVGGVPTAATDRDTTTSGLASMPWLRSGAFWVATVISAWEEFAGSFWDLLQIEYTRSLFTHLGYPLYLLTILGVWRGLCGVALLVPGFPRLKEWAYAGAFFTYWPFTYLRDTRGKSDYAAASSSIRSRWVMSSRMSP
jgi:DoxX-like family